MSKLLSLCLTPGTSPTKAEFTRIMFPVKQLLGLAIGLALGICQITGIMGVAMYVSTIM